MKNTQRQFRMAVKSLAEDGTFEGLLSPYNNVDEGGDLVEPGAFTKTLQENGNSVPMLWQHKTDCPIGELALEDRSDGLWCKGKLLLDVPEAKKAYLLLKAKIVKGLSIGYDTIKAQVVDNVRHLKEIRLWEGSVVTFPMNMLAQITDVKARDEAKGDFNEELRERQILAAWYQMIYALQDALGSAIWEGGLSRAEMITTAETSIEQFRAAYMDYLPQYLDVLAEVYGIDTKSWSAQRETKEDGHRLRIATTAPGERREHIKSAIDLLTALVADEAGETTSEVKAAAETRPEPDDLHSAVESVGSMMALLRA